MARVLYHFKMSVFSRRARLALAHKGLDCDMRDGRSNPAFFEPIEAAFDVSIPDRLQTPRYWEGLAYSGY